MHILALAFAILMTTCGQLLFKTGADKAVSDGDVIWGYIFNPRLILGLTLYFVSALLYIYALRKVPLYVAYPSLASSYVVILMVEAMVFGSVINRWQILGVLLIMAGVSLLWVKVQ